MRVAIDVQPAFKERAGVGQYTYYLVRHLPLVAPRDTFVGLVFGRGAHETAGILAADNMQLRRVRLIPARGVSLLWKTFDWPPADIFTGMVDVFHFPSFVARRLRSARAVVTIHDLAYRRMPESCEPKNVAYLEKHIPRTLDRASLVLTDSEFTARELADIYGYPRERVRVAHLGVGPAFAPRSAEEAEYVRRRHGLPERFILCVATVEPRKNLCSLLRAYRILLDGGGEVPPLVLAGSEGWREETERVALSIDRLRLRENVIRVAYVGHGELPAIYTAAELFVFPSLYEGFGLPPLEAMACGTPVVCSNAASLPEAVGDAALQVPPRDAHALAAAMRRLLDDDPLKRKLAEKGRERAKRFTWRETARKTVEAYREALEV